MKLQEITDEIKKEKTLYERNLNKIRTLLKKMGVEDSPSGLEDADIHDSAPISNSGYIRHFKNAEMKSKDSTKQNLIEK